MGSAGSTGLSGGDTTWSAVFVSDWHLGASGSRVADLHRFLKTTECERLVLVGDIVDLWVMRHRTAWTDDTSGVVQQVLKKARHGTMVEWLPGNHDEALRAFAGSNYGNLYIRDEAEYVAGDGRRYLVLHGDAFDGVVHMHPWLAHLGSLGYDWLLRVNRLLNRGRHKLGLPPWSFSHFVKRQVKEATMFITNFEEAVAAEAQRRGFDGVICGHIHAVADKYVAGIHYLNCGDWVEHTSAVVDDGAGVRVITWSSGLVQRKNLTE